ncbi:hypothetical protein F2Q70_00024249 [Brassica cretica]|uniref:WRKY domain-containing protein n=1 Tax=Brassica cretica TaxID=69181 RepID=A0A8S9L9F9_BRACR|nr:hypothetical protein F2Q70_00024249 [Brassica cretica]
MEFTSFHQPSLQSIWDFGEEERDSLGFMELLGSQHHSFLLETLQPQTQPFEKLSSSDLTILQAPPSNATADKLKPKKNSQKRQREARIAFMTKSEVDHLEDGYRWRKYGQKAVKNSPFPRSYYRCTTASCNVKKRVERSFRDPSTVVTTYEGQHTHISPLTSRPISSGGFFFGSSGVASNLGNFGFPMESSTLIYPQFQQLVHYNQQQQQQELLPCFGGVGEYVTRHADAYGDDERVKKSRGLVKDNGLLQDVVPSHMLKEE